MHCLERKEQAKSPKREVVQNVTFLEVSTTDYFPCKSNGSSDLTYGNNNFLTTDIKMKIHFLF